VIFPVYGSEKYDNCHILTIDVPRDVYPKISKLRLCIVENGELYDLNFKVLGNSGEVVKESVISAKLETSNLNENRFVHNDLDLNVKKTFTFRPSVMHGDRNFCFHRPYRQCGLMFTHKNNSQESGRLRYYKLPLR